MSWYCPMPAQARARSVDGKSNVPAAVYTAFGGSAPTGTLPVEIPALDDGYLPSDTVLYARGFGLTY